MVKHSFPLTPLRMPMRQVLEASKYEDLLLAGTFRRRSDHIVMMQSAAWMVPSATTPTCTPGHTDLTTFRPLYMMLLSPPLLITLRRHATLHIWGHGTQDPSSSTRFGPQRNFRRHAESSRYPISPGKEQGRPITTTRLISDELAASPGSRWLVNRR